MSGGMMMVQGVPVLTQKGREAISHMPPDLAARCRNILVQVDGKKSVDEIFTTLRGLDGLEEALRKLLDGGYVQVSRECRDLVKALAIQMLGVKAPAFLKKVDEMHAKYGEACWEHLDELDKAARLFYGEVVADQLKAEIARIVREARK